jgi:hypothetical protein
LTFLQKKIHVFFFGCSGFPLVIQQFLLLSVECFKGAHLPDAICLLAGHNDFG